jgi:tRNA wybutosine-synthesizing protein 3
VCPIVAIRTSGLALESIIGVVEAETDGEKEIVRALVEESYLKMLLELSNERFVANQERMTRFQVELLKALEKGGEDPWEGKEERRARKRAEGLDAKAKSQRASRVHSGGDCDIDDLHPGSLFNTDGFT